MRGDCSPRYSISPGIIRNPFGDVETYWLDQGGTASVKFLDGISSSEVTWWAGQYILQAGTGLVRLVPALRDVEPVPFEFDVEPVGALIGVVWDPATPNDLPPPARIFPVLAGGRFTMPANGKLFLGINDGSFFNNSGCFQVRVTP